MTHKEPLKAKEKIAFVSENVMLYTTFTAIQNLEYFAHLAGKHDYARKDFRDVLLAIPNAQREAAMALGSTRWEAISKVLIPYGSSGLLGAAILALGRALGETMAVTMVIGNAHDISASLFAPGYTMASLIANEFSEATTDLHVSALMAVGAGLFIVTVIVNAIARWLVWRTARGQGS